MMLIEEKKGVSLKPLKIRDVAKLLSKRFGEGWRQLDSLQFYYKLETNQHEHADGTPQDDNEGEVVDEPEDDNLDVV